MIQIIPTGEANQDGEKKRSVWRKYFQLASWSFSSMKGNFGEGGITVEGTASRSAFWNTAFVFRNILSDSEHVM